MQIDEKKVGKEYLNELKRILKIREERRLVYQDSFLHETPDALLNIINGKWRRFEIMWSNRKKTPQINDKIEDEISDIINYFLFVLCVLNKNKETK